MSLLEAQQSTQRGQRSGRLKLLPVALHAGVSGASQAAALQPTPRTHRKASAAQALHAFYDTHVSSSTLHYLAGVWQGVLEPALLQ